MGGSIPDVSVINLIDQINKSECTMIRDIIPELFKEYVHNRVGTLLNKSEKENVNILSRPNFKKGNLMIWQKRNDEYVWVIYLCEVKGTSLPQKHNIITLDDNSNKLITKDVFSNSLFSYPDNEKVLPESKKNMKYDEGHIYETYCLDQ